jgi:hypothetical protein
MDEWKWLVELAVPALVSIVVAIIQRQPKTKPKRKR